jgi:hypothetical protein
MVYSQLLKFYRVEKPACAIIGSRDLREPTTNDKPQTTNDNHKPQTN